MKTNATEEFVAYVYTDCIKQTNMCGNVLAGRHELLLSTVNRCKLSCFGHVGRRDTLPKIILQDKELWMAVVTEQDLVNHGRTTSMNLQASRSRHCCPSRMTDASIGVPHRRPTLAGIS